MFHEQVAYEKGTKQLFGMFLAMLGQHFNQKASQSFFLFIQRKNGERKRTRIPMWLVDTPTICKEAIYGLPTLVNIDIEKIKGEKKSEKKIDFNGMSNCLALIYA